MRRPLPATLLLVLFCSLGCWQEPAAVEQHQDDPKATNSSKQASQGDGDRVDQPATPSEDAPRMMVMGNDFALLKVDLAALRKTTLAKKLPVGIDEAGRVLDDLQPGLAEQTALADAVWVTLSPGPGKWEDWMFLVDGPALSSNDEVPAPPIHFSMWVRFQSEDAAQGPIEQMQTSEDLRELQHGGATYYLHRHEPVFHFVRGADWVMSTREDVIKQVIADKPRPRAEMLVRLDETNPTAQIALVADTAPLQELLEKLQENPDLEIPVQVSHPVSKLTALSATIDLAGWRMLELELTAVDAEGGDLLKLTVDSLISLGKVGIDGLIKATDQHGELESQIELLQFARQTLDEIAVTQTGGEVAVSLKRPARLEQIVEKVASQFGQVGERTRRMNNGHQIGIAYKHAAFKRVHIASQYREGKLVECWTDQLTPFLAEDTSLFETLWDSEPETTAWKMVKLPGGPRSGLAWHPLFIEGGPGSETPITQAEELDPQADDPLAILGEEPPSGYVVVFFDGHVEVLSRKALQKAIAPRND